MVRISNYEDLNGSSAADSSRRSSSSTSLGDLENRNVVAINESLDKRLMMSSDDFKLKSHELFLRRNVSHPTS